MNNISMRIVVLCGGSGSRLWPESREGLPKQFIPLLNGKSLLDLTIERILKIKFKSNPIFICNKKHRFLLTKTIEKYNLQADIFLEPVGRNTCAAIYLAAKHCFQRENLLIMPSDHLISDNQKFFEAIKNIEKNFPSDYWVTLGIKPTKPSEAYGYIKIDHNDINNELFKVTEFFEKPTKTYAAQFIRNNDYFWNAGIFMANASKIIGSIKKYSPDIADYSDKAFNEIKNIKGTNQFNFSNKLFSQIPNLSIDKAVMEHEKNIYLYPFNSQWSDVGSWDAMSLINEKKIQNNKVFQIDSHNNYIRNPKRIIATIGIEDLIIIDSDDATLISKKDHSEKVKLIVNQLTEKNVIEAIEHSFEKRPWGEFKNLLNDEYCKVKRIIVHPKKRLSLQYHNFRSEHWLIVKGTANVYLDGKKLILNPGQSIDIPKKSHHYIENKKQENLIIIETQLGTYFGEDDIIRLDDPYFR